MLTEFLRLILPSEGVYCAAIKTDHWFKHIWTPDVEALASGIDACDARGLTVYHACASYKEAGSLFKGRRQSNVHAVRSLWADVDCGPDKPYATALEGARAVVLFCGAANLPLPQFVNSGSGVHVYWPLDRDLPLDAWRVFARGLHELAKRHGLAVDPTRATDAASVLRPPGTHNRKTDPARPVIAGPLVRPFPLEQFTEAYHVGAQVVLPGVQGGRSPNRGTVCSDIASHTGDDPDAFLIASQCEQFRTFVERRGDRIAEPVWRLACAVASFTKQGDAFAHEYSKGDARYTAEETQRKIDDYRRETSGAPLCATFHRHNPQACERCPHFKRINSPVSLGYERREPHVVERNPSAVQAGPVAAAGTAATAAAPAGAVNQLPPLPPHYAWGRYGELVLTSSIDGERVDHVVSCHPVYLDSVQVGEASKEFQLVFKQHLPQEGWREILVPAATMQSSDAFAALAKYGGNVTDKRAFLEYTRIAIDHWHARNKLKMNYEQYGWKDDFTGFLFGERLYTKDGVTEISGNKELRARTQWVGPAAKYTLQDWQLRANPLFARGSEPQSIAVCAAFASPLVSLLSNEGGVVLALVSPETGKGKSMALLGCSSVWGRRKGLEIRREFSTVTRGLTFAALGNLPVIFDEMRARDPVALRDFIKTYTEGGDKVRASRDGTLKHSSTDWQNFLLTADNVSLVNLVSENEDDDDTAALRIIEIPCYLPDDLRHIYGDKLKQELDAISGLAGEVYVQWLVQPQNLQWTRDMLQQVYQDIYKDTGWDERHRFWVRGIACICVAGLIVKQLGIIDFDVPRIVRWLMHQCQLRVRPKAEVSVAANAITVLTRYLDQNVGQRLVVNGPFTPFQTNIVHRHPTSGHLAVRFELKPKRYLIDRHAFRVWCIELGLPHNTVVDALAAQGVCTDKRKRMTLGAGTEYEGGQTWCFVIDGNHAAMSGVAPEVALSNVVPMKAVQSS